MKAEQNAKNLAERINERIANEADDICIDRMWYFEKVIQYMRENEIRILVSEGNPLWHIQLIDNSDTVSGNTLLRVVKATGNESKVHSI